jgi:hypothetical protein
VGHVGFSAELLGRLRGSRRPNAELACASGRLGPFGGAELLEDTRDVLLHRVERHVPPLGNLPVAHAAGKRPQHLQLAFAERCHQAPAPARSSASRPRVATSGQSLARTSESVARGSRAGWWRPGAVRAVEPRVDAVPAMADGEAPVHGFLSAACARSPRLRRSPAGQAPLPARSAANLSRPPRVTAPPNSKLHRRVCAIEARTCVRTARRMKLRGRGSARLLKAHSDSAGPAYT